MPVGWLSDLSTVINVKLVVNLLCTLWFSLLTSLVKPPTPTVPSVGYGAKPECGMYAQIMT